MKLKLQSVIFSCFLSKQMFNIKTYPAKRIEIHIFKRFPLFCCRNFPENNLGTNLLHKEDCLGSNWD